MWYGEILPFDKISRTMKTTNFTSILMPDTAFGLEAKVISEHPAHIEEPRSPEQETTVHTEGEVPVKKKKNPVLIIILILFGLGVLFCSCAIGAVVALNVVVQKSPQAVAVRSLYTALNDGDSAKVKELTTDKLYEDLYSYFNETDTLAKLFTGNVTKVTVTSVNVDNDTAAVTYKLEQKQEEISNLEYAELQKIDDKWIVTYIGPKPEVTE